MRKRGLVVVDVQNDFLPGGALAVPHGDEIIPHINKLVKLPFDVCVATKDFHPPHHQSFASTWEKKPKECILVDGVMQTLWPDHCVQGTLGAEFSSKLDTSHFEYVALKGVDLQEDSYSTFFDLHHKKHSTGLDEFLRSKGATDLYFAGLATDYCVLYSVLDAIELGYKAYIIVDACRGIELQKGDVEAAFEKMQQQGAECITTEQVIKKLSINDF